MNPIVVSLVIWAMIHISCAENAAEKDIVLDLLESLNKKLALMEESNFQTKQTILKLENENVRLASHIEKLERLYHPKTKLVSSGQPKAPGQIMRTCAEYLESDPDLPSGNYMIDPDGLGSGHTAFEAYCDMSTGTTMVSHDTENPINATKCSPPGCYERAVVYSTTARQIQALKALSVGCRQKIQYDCILAPLEFNGISYSYWSYEQVPKDKTNLTYWSGPGTFDEEGKLIHKCLCGEQGNCVDSLFKCNCDAFYPDLQSDIGYLTNKTQLPVRYLFFGRITSNSQGTHTLGKLECYGKSPFPELPSSCEDLWKMGHSLSGIYTVQKDGSNIFVYCNMEQLFGEDFEKPVCTTTCVEKKHNH